MNFFVAFPLFLTVEQMGHCCQVDTLEKRH